MREQLPDGGIGPDLQQLCRRGLTVVQTCELRATEKCTAISLPLVLCILVQTHSPVRSRAVSAER